MTKKRSAIDVASSVDLITNIVNVGLIIIGVVLISLGIFYLVYNMYDYLLRIGILLVIAGAISIFIGFWGFLKHARIVKKMKLEAKANLNY
jgi:hypothetical protein